MLSVNYEPPFENNDARCNEFYCYTRRFRTVFLFGYDIKGQEFTNNN